MKLSLYCLRGDNACYREIHSDKHKVGENVKITNIESYPVWNNTWNFVFVVVDTDEGIYGVGEAGSPGREQAVMGLIEHFKPMLIGQDPSRIEHLWQSLFRGFFFPAQRLESAAISAIDMALWDIKGKALGVPVYDLLGGRVRDKVVCYPHNVGHQMEIAPLVESCLETKAAGWKFVRFGLPNDGETLEPRPVVLASIKQFQAVREAIGDEIEICFDVHTRLDLPDALWLCKEVEQFHPFFIEDPLRAENPDSFKTLRPRTTVPLAAGEQFCSKWEFRQLIEEEWIDYARIDLCHAGGLTEAKKDRRLVRDALHQTGAAQPDGPHLNGSVSTSESCLPQFRRTGASHSSRNHSHRSDSGTTCMGRWVPAAPNRARSRRRI